MWNNIYSTIKLNKLFVAILAIASIAYFFLLSNGIGLSPDSINYLDAQDRILRGLGLSLSGPLNTSIPFNHYPPGFPYVLCFLNFFPADILIVYAIFNYIVFICSGILIYCLALVIIKNRTNSSLLSGAALLSYTTLSVFSFLLSEPLFLLIILIILYLLIRRSENLNNSNALIIGVLIGISILLRFSAVFLLAMMALLLLTKTVQFTNKKGIISLIIGLLLPLMFWIIPSVLSEPGLSDRIFSLHPPNIIALKEGLNVVVSWLFGTKMPGMLRVSLFAFVILYLIKINSKIKLRRASAILGIALVCYLAVVLFSMSFVDANTQLNYKILFPCLAIFFLLIISLGIKAKDDKRETRIITIILFSTSIILGLIDSLPLIREARTNGIGINSAKWNRDFAIRHILYNSNPLVYTNAPEAIQFYLGTRPFSIPASFNKYSLTKNDLFKDQIKKYNEHMQLSAYTLVLHNSILDDQVEELLERQELILSSGLFNLYSLEGIDQK